jgi:hypothetical protein
MKLNFREKCVGWGLVLTLPPLILLIPMFAFSCMVPPELHGLDWWTAVLENLFRAAFRTPGEAILFLSLVTMQLAGLFLIVFGFIPTKHKSAAPSDPRITRLEDRFRRP